MKFILILPLLLMACNKPNPVTDTQIQIIAEQCKEKGQHVVVFNSPIVSRAYCE